MNGKISSSLFFFLSFIIYYYVRKIDVMQRAETDSHFKSQASYA